MLQLTHKSVIAIVDTNQHTRELALEYWQRKGCTVIHCTSAQQLLYRLAQIPDKVDLLITDQYIPNDPINGQELADRLKESSPNIQVFIFLNQPVTVDVGYMSAQTGYVFLEGAEKKRGMTKILAAA